MSPQPWSPADGLFILSCHRSGSTLLRFILDTHPEIYSPPETFFGPCASYLIRFRSGLSGTRDGDVPSPSTPEELDWVRGILGSQMQVQTQRRGKRIWCEKTPDNLGHLALLDSLFPRARFLCLHRHALDVIKSSTKMAIPDFGPYLFRSEGHVENALLLYWNERTRESLEFETAHPERCFRLRYEDLVTSPERILEPLFAFLGVAWDPELLGSVFTSKHDPGVEDHYARFSTQIYSTSLGAGRDVSLARAPVQDVREMEALLARLGYKRLPEPKAPVGGNEKASARGAASVRWLFEVHLPERLRAAPVRSAGSSYQFTIAGENGDGGTWLIDTNPGALSAKPGEGGAMCLLELAASDILELANGRTNPLKAFDQGKIRVQGTFELSALRELFDLLRV